MRDGVELSADIYLPDEEGRFPVILMRTPYNKSRDSYLEQGQYFSSHSFAVVCMDVRGRGDSDGEFAPYRNDGRDGYDSIEWCAEQPWSDGNVGTLGGSYLGRIQWLAALEKPPHLKTMIVLVTPSDPFVEWPTGIPIPMDIGWFHFTSGHVNQNLKAVNWSEVYWHLPLYTMDERIGRTLFHFREEFDHPRLDEYWEPLRYQNKFDQLDLPVLHISGWYDDEQIGTPLNYIGMTTQSRTEKSRKSQKMMMGPWPHKVNSVSKLAEVDFGPDAIIDLKHYQRRWFDYWLKGIDSGIMDEPPVRIFVMGENSWRDENEWPLARAKMTDYFFHSNGRANSLFGDGTLSTTPPENEPPDHYRYDPANPVPFITDPEFSQIGSADDYRPIERRDDVLVYTTEVLTEAVEVCGPITVTLYAATSARDTDFMAKLIDVWPGGYAQRLCDGMVRARFREGMEKQSFIEPGEVYAYTINCWNTCQLFEEGHRIRLEISSSAFPKYDRNLNTAEALGRSTEMIVADQTIYHDALHPSHATLPLVD